MNVRQACFYFFCVLLPVVVGGWAWERYENQAIRLTLVTGVQHGGFDKLGQLIQEAVHDYDKRVEIVLQRTEGSVGNVSKLKAGEAELAIVQNDTDPREVDVQTLLPLNRGVFHFLVRRDSDIRSVYDLRGKRVGVGPRSSGNLHIVSVLLQHFGIEMGELACAYEDYGESMRRLGDGQRDAVLVVTAIHAEAMLELVQNVDVRYVSLASNQLTGNEVDGFAVTYPYVERFTIPKFVYPHKGQRRGLPAQPCETFALRSSLVCRADLPDSVARRIVEAIVSHRTSMMRQDLIAQDITEHFDAEELQFPIHHGAMAYFQRQRPSFIERYSEPMAFMLSLFLAFCGLVAAFNKWISLRKKNRIDRYYSRLDELLTELNAERPTSERLDAIEQELLGFRHDAVRALVHEQLLADDSFQIFQSLLTDCHQQLSILRRPPRRPDASR